MGDSFGSVRHDRVRRRINTFRKKCAILVAPTQIFIPHDRPYRANGIELRLAHAISVNILPVPEAELSQKRATSSFICIRLAYCHRFSYQVRTGRPAEERALKRSA